MIIDSTGNVINNINDVLDHFLAGGSLDALQFGCYDPTVNLELHNQRSDKLDHIDWIINLRRPYANIQDMDTDCLATWMIPKNYKQLDIVQCIIDQCVTDQELERVQQELEVFVDRGFLDVLRAIKYLVDIMKENNIIWGVGRGSSVASYCLYLLGAHSIDSIKYGLDFGEFL